MSTSPLPPSRGDPEPPTPDRDPWALWAPVAHNLSVAVVAVAVIAAVAIGLVYVLQSLHL